MSAHIPDSHEKTTLFYGWHSNRTRGYRKRHGLLAKAEAADPAADADGTRAPLAGRRAWARVLRQVYEIDPLRCPRGGGTMNVIAVIERQAVVRQILAHRGLPTRAPGLRAPPDQPACRVADPPRKWSYAPLG